MAETKAYCQAVGTGLYEKPSGLLGKYDNVRRFWEDQVTARFLAPHIMNLIQRKQAQGDRIRILDLGCGSGDGFELISAATGHDMDISCVDGGVLGPEVLSTYVGVDINEDLICQAERCFGKLQGLRFVQGDLSNGLPANIAQEQAFDFYSAGYGTLSHFHDDLTARLIADICRHAPDGALFMGDWLGRFSYEWQDLWHHPLDREYFMDYRISYIYPEDEREGVEISSFPLRLMTRDEILAITTEAAAQSGTEIRPLVFFDRSLFVGRHMETGDYSGHRSRTRAAVNSLFERCRRTDLKDLLVDYQPREGFGELNTFFESYFDSCNSLVKFAGNLLEEFDRETESLGNSPSLPADCNGPVKEALEMVQQSLQSVDWLPWCDVRADIVEPMLGYALRKLEMDLQPGSGMGHGLIGVFEIRK